MRDQLADGSAGSGRLLHAVAGKTVAEVKIRHFGMGADDRVLVERVVVVVPGPRVQELDLGEGWDAVRERRPDDFLEECVLDLKVIRVRVVFGGRRDAADEAL